MKNHKLSDFEWSKAESRRSFCDLENRSDTDTKMKHRNKDFWYFFKKVRKKSVSQRNDFRYFWSQKYRIKKPQITRLYIWESILRNLFLMFSNSGISLWKRKPVFDRANNRVGGQTCSLSNHRDSINPNTSARVSKLYRVVLCQLIWATISEEDTIFRDPEKIDSISANWKISLFHFISLFCVTEFFIEDKLLI